MGEGSFRDKKTTRFVQSFRYNTDLWQTDRRTDTGAYRASIASRDNKIGAYCFAFFQNVATICRRSPASWGLRLRPTTGPTEDFYLQDPIASPLPESRIVRWMAAGALSKRACVHACGRTSHCIVSRSCLACLACTAHCQHTG